MSSGIDLRWILTLAGFLLMANEQGVKVLVDLGGPLLDVSFDEFLEFNPILADTLDVEKCRSLWSSQLQKVWRILRV